MLINRIERYLRTSGMKPTRFGWEAVRDPRLVYDLRRGREPGRTLSERVDAYMRGAGQ